MLARRSDRGPRAGPRLVRTLRSVDFLTGVLRVRTVSVVPGVVCPCRSEGVPEVEWGKSGPRVRLPPPRLRTLKTRLGAGKGVAHGAEGC